MIAQAVSTARAAGVRGQIVVRPHLLPGVHLIDVIKRDQQGFALFNRCGTFAAKTGYQLLNVEFVPAPPPDRLALPPTVQSQVAELKIHLGTMASLIFHRKELS